MHIRHTLLAAALAVAAGPAAAVTFDYDATVTSSPGPAAAPGVPDFPPVGAPASISLTVSDGSPMNPLDDATLSSLATANLVVPGYLESFSDTFPPENVTLSETEFGFSATLPTTLSNPGDLVPSSFNINSFRATFGSPLAAPPATVGDLITALSAPGLSGVFSAELNDATTDQSYFVTATFDTSVPVVPLPATGLLLAGAIGAAAALRRKR